MTQLTRRRRTRLTLVTVHGRPSAVLLSVDDLEALEETIAILPTAMRSGSSPPPMPSWPEARAKPSRTSPDAVAFAAYEFIVGPLLDNPHRVGKSLRPPLDDRYSVLRGTYRVIYRIDTGRRRVTVVGVVHRADAYRPQ